MTRIINYDYEVVEAHGLHIIMIVDESNERGGMSVTNCIEDVVREICEEKKVIAEDHYVVYRDTMGVWDGWDPITESFISFNGATFEGAIKILLDRRNKFINSIQNTNHGQKRNY